MKRFKHRLLAIVILIWGGSDFVQAQPMPETLQASIEITPVVNIWNGKDDRNDISRYDSEKTKKIRRSFKVGSSEKLLIENRYGKVHINTWDKNEIVVNIDIIAKASSDDRAQEILDMITIDEEKTDNLISFKTHISKSSGNNWGKKSSYAINYTVSMPKKNPLQARNMYGDLYLADYSGNADLSLSYGSLKIGKLTGESSIKLAYGSGSNSIAQIKQGSLNLSYSKLTLEETDNLELRNSYSDISIGKAGTINMTSKYGSVEIKSVNSLEGSSGYSGFKIGALSDKISLKLQYCSGFKIDNISPKFNVIDLDGNYSSFDLNFGKGVNFNFDVDLQYADLQVDKDYVEYKVVEKRNTSSKYQGKYGKSSANGAVKVVSRYGSVKFNQQE